MPEIVRVITEFEDDTEPDAFTDSGIKDSNHEQLPGGKMHSYIKLNISLHVIQFIWNLHLQEYQDFLVLDINVRDT